MSVDYKTFSPSNREPKRALSARSPPTRFLSERRRALEEPGVGKAAHLIKDAILGYQDAPYEGYYDPYQNEQSIVRNNISVVCGRLVIQLKGAVLLASWVLFLLTFVEPPNWCRDVSNRQTIVTEQREDDLTYGVRTTSKEYGDCKTLFDAYGTTADNVEDQSYYPNSSSMLLTIYQSKIIELACVAFISLYMLLAFAEDGLEARFFFFPGYKRWCHASQCIVLFCLIASAIFNVTIYNPFLRMIILGAFLRTLQREMRSFFKMIPELLIPLSLLAIIVLFYAWFGVVIFYDSPQGMAAFPNLAEGMWTLWICVTTANYPDVSMPSYNEHRGVALFFISFMVLSFFYLMNLVLAVAVNAHDESTKDRKVSRRKISKKLLSEAFTLLDSNGSGYVSRGTIMNVMTILNQDVSQVRGLTDEEKAIMYACLDKDGDSSINQEEFSFFGSVLLLKVEKVSHYTTFVECHFPSVFRSDFYQTLCKFVKSKKFETIIDLVLVMNAGIVAAQDYPMLAGLDASQESEYQALDTAYEGAETFFTVIYVIEAMLKIMVSGWKQYIESPRNAYDFIICCVVVLASAYVYYPNAYNDPILIEFIVMARVLRLGRLLFTVKRFRMFGAVSLEIIPAAASVFVMLLFIEYFFASLGMMLYGGTITRDPSNPTSKSLLKAEDFVDNEYWANNFNDMISGMVVLFNWLVVNNWTTQTAGLEYASGDKWLVRLFFFLFYLLGVIGISNVVTSFIINEFFQQLETFKNRQVIEENVDGEVTLEGSRAVFDPSTITGTETGLGPGTYFARMKPNHLDDEMNEREELKQLFSKSSSVSDDKE